MSEVIKIDGASLLLFALPDGLVVESYELATILGYAQHSSIRKQIRTDWKAHIKEPEDYRLVHDHRWLQKYEAVMKEKLGVELVPVKQHRGRLFLTAAGLEKVLARTSKPKAALEAALRQHGFLDVGTPSTTSQSTSSAPEADPVGSLVDLKRGLAEVRQHNYDVLQKLLSQLNELQDDDLKLLAIEAAEIALGRHMPDLRAKYAKRDSSAPPPSNQELGESNPVVRRLPDGPVFKETGFYGLKQIGEMAGGYASAVAGKAANLVAEGMGYTAEQIRTEQLPFNELPVLPDSTTGKPRKMYRFNKDFSNAVVRELRDNPQFRPRDRPMPLTSFSSGASSHPKLSQGPFGGD